MVYYFDHIVGEEEENSFPGLDSAHPSAMIGSERNQGCFFKGIAEWYGKSLYVLERSRINP